MSELFTRKFVIDAADRAVRTFAQSALGAGIVGATDILSVNWIGVLSVGGLAAAISVLTSLAAERVGEPGTASVTKAEPQ